jgi:ribonuclease VapC
MFVDASAIVAILTGENERDSFTDLLDAADTAITSPIAIFEAVLAIRRKRRASVETATEIVRAFIEATDLEVLQISTFHAEEALAAYARYGKGGGHAAQLNMGDCFAYAAAKIANAAILFKGNDFSETDLISGDPTGEHR